MVDNRPAAGTYLSQLLEHAPVGVLRLDSDGSVAAANPAAGALFELDERELPGRKLARLFSEDTEIEGAVASVLADGEDISFRVRRGPEESPTYIQLSFYRFVEDGEPPAVVVIMQDVTESVTVARQREQILEQVDFLAETSAALGSSVDMHEVFEQLCEIAVPRLADWIALDVLDPDGSVQRVGVHHNDPDLAETAQALADYHPDPANRLHPVVRALIKERPVVVNDLDGDAVGGLTYDDKHRQLLAKMGVRSVLVFPLTARGKLLGSLTLVSSTNPKRFGATQLSLARDIAARAGLALDNARLLSEHIYLARRLQESLLPPSMPAIPGFEVAAHYRSAGEGIEVGGDFYDFFRTGTKSWSVVMGDVSGKGPDAAIVTTLARYTIRAAAMQARAPRRILGILNEALLDQTPVERFATVAFVRIRTGDEGSSRKLTVACGGHPLPLIMRSDGSIEEAGAPGTVLGLMDKVTIKDHTVTLSAGDALLLFTDGVTEARSGDHMLGIHGLRTALASCRGLPASSIVEQVAKTVLDFQKGQLRDDMAIVALRVPDAI